MKRKYLVIILAVVILLGTNATFASEHGNETLTLHESALEQSVEETQTDVLSNENDVGSLKDIKDLISKTPSGGEIKLNKSYVYNPTTDNDNNQIYASVVINKAVTIDGGGNTISGDNKFKIFTVSSSGVTLKNIKFINAFTEGNGGALDVGYGSHNLKLINCSFENCKAAVYGGAITIKQANNVEIIDCDFISNIGDPDRVSRGGAINWEFCDGGTLTGCNFIDNSAHYGGAVYSYSSSNIKIYNNHFENNSAGSYAADIWSDDNYATLHDCDFINSKAKLYGGSIYWKGSNSYIYSLNFTNVTAQQGGAFYLINGANVTIAKSNFKQSKATNNGGAIYAVSSTHITDCNFTDGEAGSAGGVYISGKGCSIKKSTFTNNHATNENGGCVFVYGDNCVIDETSFDTSSTMNPNKSGGIIYWSGANGVLTNSELKRGSSKYGGAVYLNGANAELSDNDFIDNLASNYGGAIYSNSKLAKINKAYFIGNNATAGSAIFKTTVVNYLTDMTFVHNQAHSRDITITNEGKRFTATYRAYDNILNAIWNNGAVTSIFIDGVNPVKGVENSNNGELLYQDDREYDQTIVVSVLDNDNNVVESETLKTGLYGEVNFTAKKGVKIVFAHPEDVFYKGISNDAPIPDFSVEKIALTPQVFQDSDIKFEITVKNTGKVDLTGIVITEDDFKGLTYVSYHESPLWTYSNVGGKPTWKLNSKLVPEEVATLIVTFKAHDVGTYNNTVVVTCDGDITESANASVTIIPDTFEAMKLSLIPLQNLETRQSLRLWFTTLVNLTSTTYSSLRIPLTD